MLQLNVIERCSEPFYFFYNQLIVQDQRKDIIVKVCSFFLKKTCKLVLTLSLGLFTLFLFTSFPLCPLHTSSFLFSNFISLL